MGCCASDALPDVPDNIIPDPDVNTTITAVTKRLGRGRDYSVHKDAYPKDSSSEVKQKMWLWFNKSNGGVIDLENFERGWKEDEPKKGKVLFSATVTEKPHFEQFQRVVRNNVRHRFMGFKKRGQQQNADGGYDSEDDDYYMTHPNHKDKFRGGKRYVGQPHYDIITKWRLNTCGVLRDGNLGRAADILRGKEVYLEVFSKGTVVTSWEEIEHRTTDKDGKTQVDRRDVKRETEFVDRVEFRLSVDNKLWAEWVVQGDTRYKPGSNTTIDSPLFTTTIEGGWFTKSAYTTTTKPGVDPALALLIAHLCYTEYSVEEIKRDLKPNTPHRPPSLWSYTPPAAELMEFKGLDLVGDFKWGQ